MNTVIEGQQAHTEQIDRQFTSLKKDIKDSTLIKSPLKSVSSDVKNIKQNTDTLEEKFEEIKDVTAQNSYYVQGLRNSYKKKL